MRFEDLYGQISNDKLVNNDKLLEFKSKLRALSMNYFYNFKPYKVFCAIFTKSDFSELKSLGNNKDIILCKPDKGRGVVLVDRSLYVEKMTTLISDGNKFSEICESIQTVSLRVEDKINNFLRKLKNLSYINENVYKKLFVSGTGPGILYGLPKIHKIDFKSKFQFRPIFASYNTAPYRIAKFLVSVLAPLTTNEFTLQNSYSFISDISSQNNANDLFMASYDVENLFSNVPLHETINICLNKLFPTDQSYVLGMPRKYFKTLLELSVLNSFFMFNSKLYKQLEGLGMGLPLGPTFANIFMCFHETSWIHDCPDNFKPLFYRRYIDDTFVLFKDRSHATLFLNYLNSKHANIHFTMDSESQGKLAFLDITVSRSNNKFVTSVYRKLTFTGLGTSFFSHSPFLFKVNAIKTLLFRAFRICSDYKILHDEFEFLKDFFSRNGYSISLFHYQVRKFLDKVYDNSNSINSSNNSTSNFFVLPYFGPQSEKLKSELLALLKKYSPDNSFRIILINNFKIGSFFNYKDKIPTVFRSSVIYEYTCPTCGVKYVGSTSRTLCARTAEHVGVSSRTGRSLTSPPHSSIRDHSDRAHSAAVKTESFKILDSESNPVRLRILESIYINKLKPQLNETLSAYPLNILQ